MPILKLIAHLSRAHHWSDCSLHNGPSFLPETCDCGGFPANSSRWWTPLVNWAHLKVETAQSQATTYNRPAQ